jgi:hypothetical protein
MNTNKRWAGVTPTRTELAALTDPDAVYDLFAYADERLRGEEQNVPEGLSILHAAWVLDCEIKNGGFDQYFWNRGLEHATFTLAALKRIGDEGRGAVLAQAIALFHKEGTKFRFFKKRGKLEDYATFAKDGLFRELDSLYYKAPGAMEEKLVAYVRSHPNEFADR